MRIDFSEPECSNCFHCRTLNTRETEPSNVITPVPVSSGPVGHDPADVGSTAPSVNSEPSQPPVGSDQPASRVIASSVNSEQAAIGSGPSASSVIASSVQAAFGSMQAPASHSGTSSFASGSLQPPTFGSATSASNNSCFAGFAAPTPGPKNTCFGYGEFDSPLLMKPRFEFGKAAPSLFGTPSFGSMQTPTFGSYPLPMPPRTESMQAPLSFGKAAPSLFDVPINTPAHTVVFGTTPVSVSSNVGPRQELPKANSVFAAPQNPFGLPGFGVDHSPGFLGPNPSPAFGGGGAASPSFNAATGPLPTATFGSRPGFGFQLFASHDRNEQGGPPFAVGSASTSFHAATGALPSSSSFSTATFGSHPGFGSQIFASHDRSEQGAPTPFVAGSFFGDNGNMVSISASEPYKSHEELRWETYQKTGSRPNTPWPFASQRTPFGTMLGTKSVVSSSPASGCTACGATSSSSSPGYFNFNGATTTAHPSTTSAYYHPWLFSAPFPMMFGATPVLPIMFAHVPTPSLQGTPNLAPSLEANHVNSFILPTFAAMNLH